MWIQFGRCVFPLDRPTFAWSSPKFTLNDSPGSRVTIALDCQPPSITSSVATYCTAYNCPHGWHTFRHSFGTLLKANGEDVKTVQELLRQANSRFTLDVYTQAVNTNKRAAQSEVVRMIVSDVGQ